MSVETSPLTPSPAPPSPAPELGQRDRWQRLRSLSGASFELSRGAAFTIVALLVLGSLLLRLRDLHTFYWIDEGLSVGIASHPLRHIPSLLRQDGSPPLYYLLLHVWMSIRGHGEAATHELSLIFALLSVPTAYWAGSSLFGRRTGICCAVLAAGAPYLTTYAEETRMYAIVAWLSIIVSASFVHAFVFGRRRYLAVFALSLAAALYTHNWALFLTLSSCIAFMALLWRAEGDQRGALLRDGAIAFGAAALLYAPWLPTLAYQASHTGAPWALPPVFWSLTQGLYSLTGGRGAAVAILLAGGSGLLALWRLHPHERRFQQPVLVLVGLGVGTLLIGWAYSKTTPAWAFRYLAVIVGPLLLAAGLGLSRAGRLGLVALVLVAGFWVLDPIKSSKDYKSNLASVVARLRPELGRDPLVISTQPEQVPTLAYYLPRVTRFGTTLGPTPDPRVVDWRDALNRLRHGSVRGTLMPLLSTVAVGQRVLLIVPVNLLKAPLWMGLINRDSTHWTSALERDRSFRLVGESAAKVYSAGVAVRGLLFARLV